MLLPGKSLPLGFEAPGGLADKERQHSPLKEQYLSSRKASKQD